MPMKKSLVSVLVPNGLAALTLLGVFGMAEPYIPAKWLEWSFTFIPAAALTLFFLYALFTKRETEERGVVKVINKLGLPKTIFGILIAVPCTALILAFCGATVFTRSGAFPAQWMGTEVAPVNAQLMEIGPFMRHWIPRKTVEVFLEDENRTQTFTLPLDEIVFAHCANNRIVLNVSESMFGMIVNSVDCRRS